MNNTFDSAEKRIREIMASRVVDPEKEVIFVVDWGCELMRDLPRLMTKEPWVDVMPRAKVIAMCSEVSDDFENALSRVSGDWVVAVILSGKTIGLHRVETYQMTTKKHFHEVDGVDGGYTMDTTGILLLMFRTDPKDVKEGPSRDRIVRFRKLARETYAREMLRPNPRPLDVMLYEEFGGEQMHEALKAGNLDLALNIPVNLIRQVN